MSKKLVVALLSTGLIGLGVPGHAGGGPVTRRLSVDSNGQEGPGESYGYIDGLSDDGKLAAFVSNSAFVSADDNGDYDVYLRNLATGKTKAMSIRNANGKTGDGGESNGPGISGNGRVVVFYSEASNLTATDDDDTRDIFVRDLRTKKTELISIGSNGQQTNEVEDQPAINYTGRFVAFATAAQLAGNDNNHATDIYVRDRKKDKTRLVSVDSQGNDNASGDSSMPTISSSGRYVAFHSESEDMIANDSNDSIDIYRHDRKTGKTRRLSISSNGSEKTGDSREASISANGRIVAFESLAEFSQVDSNGYDDIYLRNVRTGVTTLITRDVQGEQTDEESGYPAISPNGRMVGFFSRATDLIQNDPPGQYSAYVFDRTTDDVAMVDRSSSGEPGDGDSDVSGMSGDGRFVMVSSRSTNTVPNDENSMRDVFRRGPLY